MNILKSIKSIFINEGIVHFIKRKRKEYRKLTKDSWYTIKYENTKTQIFLKPRNGWVDNFIYENGIYEKDIIDIIKNNVNKESVFLDVGANIGQHSLIISHFCKKVIALEPLPTLANQFLGSIEKNNFKNIEIVRLGAGSETGETEVYVDVTQSGYTSILSHLEDMPNLRKDLTHQLEKHIIKIDTLDHILKDKERIDFIKMDIEGYEYYAFLGALKTLKKHKPKIILEFSNLFYENHEAGLSEKFFNLILSLGYQIKSIERNVILHRIEDIAKEKKQENYFLF